MASIKPNAANDHRVMIGMAAGGQFTATGVTLHQLMMEAFDVRDHQITGLPGWANADRYDVSAKAEGDVQRLPEEQLRAMLRNLLIERFQLATHSESKEMPVYELVVGKQGHKLKPSESGHGENMMRVGRGQISATGISLAMLADSLTSQTGRTVFDKTGLQGNFDFKLEFTPDSGRTGMPPPPPGTILPADSIGPTIFTALHEQLGLKLEPARGPVPTIVVDKASKPSEN